MQLKNVYHTFCIYTYCCCCIWFHYLAVCFLIEFTICRNFSMTLLTLYSVFRILNSLISENKGAQNICIKWFFIFFFYKKELFVAQLIKINYRCALFKICLNWAICCQIVGAINQLIFFYVLSKIKKLF